MNEIRYTQIVLADLSVEKLPDGSTAMLDRRTMSVHSLNASATIAWEACRQGASLAQVRRALELQSRSPVREEIAASALAQLQQVNLITTYSIGSTPVVYTPRRSVLQHLAGAAGIAVPLVLTLTAAEQRAAAFDGVSGPV